MLLSKRAVAYGRNAREFRVQLSEDETLFQNSWKRYYKHIAIEERKNHNLRRQNMPKKILAFFNRVAGAKKVEEN